MRSHRRLVSAHEPRSGPLDRSRGGPQGQSPRGSERPLRGSPPLSLSPRLPPRVGTFACATQRHSADRAPGPRTPCRLRRLRSARTRRAVEKAARGQAEGRLARRSRRERTAEVGGRRCPGGTRCRPRPIHRSGRRALRATRPSAVRPAGGDERLGVTQRADGRHLRSAARATTGPASCSAPSRSSRRIPTVIGLSAAADDRSRPAIPGIVPGPGAAPRSILVVRAQ